MPIDIIHIVGARPNFMKVAPVLREMRKYDRLRTHLIHTGQHYDCDMSDIFFKELGLLKPKEYLNVGSSSGTKQMAEIMVRFERVAKRIKPKLVMVYGDVNSTVACALVAKKLHIAVAHVEAGLRCYDQNMPEEINRVVTDILSDLLFTHSLEANHNLLKEGISPKNIHFVGNVMIDSLIANWHKIQNSQIHKKSRLKKKEYVVLTLHRPSNVDHKRALESILKAVNEICQRYKVIFPVHPRTSKNMKSFFNNDMTRPKSRFILTPPLGYIHFLKLLQESFCVLTDSGGIQEETTFLGVPCLTLRDRTERPITVSEGTNRIVGAQTENILEEFSKVGLKSPKYKKPRFWDGKSSQRIVKIINHYFGL